MRIVLRLSGDAEADGGALKTVTLGERDFFIGRDQSSDWMLADALGMMSRRHCSLKAEGNSVLLTDLSSNGTSIGSPGNRLVQGQPTPLSDTETIYLGGGHIRLDYECHREEQPADTDDFWGVNEIKRSRGQDKPKGPEYDSLDLLGDEDPDRNNPLSLTLDAADDRAPMSDVLSLDDAPAPRPAAPPPQAAPDHVTFETPRAASSSTHDDLFALDSGEPDPFADLGGGGAPASDLSLDDPAPPPQAPPAADPLSLDDGLQPPAADLLSLDDVPPAAPMHPQTQPPAAHPATVPPGPLPTEDDPRFAQPIQRPAPQHPRTTFAPPPSAAPPQAPAPQAPSPQAAAPAPPPRPAPSAPPRPAPAAAPASDGQAEQALAALFASVGIPINEIPPENRQEMAAEIGRSFRALADGMRELLASRRDVKIALGLGATQIETGSNPLKFARDANGAVNSLLRPSASGFLKGSTAVHDAVTALQQHQVALVGGVKASMKVALEAFDPHEIEKKLSRKGLSHVIAMKRKAELWEQFVENYKGFASEADEDIRRVIGKQLEQLYADEATRSRAALDL